MVFECCAGLAQHMDGPLKRKLVVSSHPRESRYSRVDGLEIHKEERVLQPNQLLLESWAEPRLSRLHAVASPPLSLVQWEVIWDVVDGLDAHFRQFLNGAGLDSGYIADVVIGARRIAAVVELARDRVGAMATRRDVRCLRHIEDGEFCP